MEALDYGLVRGIISIVVFAAFIGLVFWAYSGRRKKDFDEAARLPLDNDALLKPGTDTNKTSEGTVHD